MTLDDPVVCPHCGKGTTTRASFGQLGVVALIFGSCALWVPIVGWLVAPFAFVAMAILWLMALLPFRFTQRLRRCLSCRSLYFIPS
jgi:hypothetical protein